MKTASIFLASAISVLLAGCGGGGGSGTDAAPPQVAVAPPAVIAPPVGITPPAVVTPPGVVTPPVVITPPVTPPSTATIVVQLNAAISALFGQPHDFINTVKSTAGDSYEARIIYSNVVDTSIENKTVKSVDIKRTVTKNGAPFFSSAETSFFQLGPYQLVATKTPDNPLYVVASNQVALPTEAKAGDSGAFYKSTTYESIGKNLVLSTAVHTWSVVAESATTVLFCDNSVISVAQVSGTTTRADCYQIDSNSNVVSNRLVIPGLN